MCQDKTKGIAFTDFFLKVKIAPILKSSAPRSFIRYVIRTPKHRRLKKLNLLITTQNIQVNVRQTRRSEVIPRRLKNKLHDRIL